LDVAHLVRNNVSVFGIRGEGRSATHRALALMGAQLFLDLTCWRQSPWLYDDGRVVDAVHYKGQTKHFHYAAGEYMAHSVENSGDTDLVFTTVEFLDGPNLMAGPSKPLFETVLRQGADGRLHGLVSV
jgi:hypothetical protein